MARMADLVTRIERLHADLVMSKNWPDGMSQAKTKRLLSGLRQSFMNHIALMNYIALRDALTLKEPKRTTKAAATASEAD